MLALCAQASPGPAPPTPDADEAAVRRAYVAAGGASSTSPCGFHRLGPQAEPLLGPLRARAGRARGWVLVAGPGRADHRERCLTAAQRFMLSLSWDGLPNAWVEAGLPDGDAFRAAGVDLGTDVPVGLIWWGV